MAVIVSQLTSGMLKVTKDDYVSTQWQVSQDVERFVYMIMINVRR